MCSWRTFLCILVRLPDIDHIVTNILFVTGKGISMRIDVCGTSGKLSEAVTCSDQLRVARGAAVQTGVAGGKPLSEAVLAATLS